MYFENAQQDKYYFITGCIKIIAKKRPVQGSFFMKQLTVCCNAFRSEIDDKIKPWYANYDF